MGELDSRQRTVVSVKLKALLGLQDEHAAGPEV